MKKSLKYLLAFVVSGLPTLPLLVQNSTDDSLTALLEKTKDDSTRINLMLDISSDYHGKNNDNAIKFAKEAYLLAKSIINSKYIVQTLIYIGNSIYYIGDISKR